MEEHHWESLMKYLIPQLLLDVESNMDRYQTLGPILWDLIDQSILPAEKPTTFLDLNFVLKFLIRNVLRNSALQGRCSQHLLTILFQQRLARQLRPRMSSFDASSFTLNLENDVNILFNSTATFKVTTSACDSLQKLLNLIQFDWK